MHCQGALPCVIPFNEGVEKHRSLWAGIPIRGATCVSVSLHMFRWERVLWCAVQALAMQDAYEAEDEVDDAADDAEEAQQKRSRAAALASGSPLPDTSAYFHERLYWGACIALHCQCCMLLGPF